jgi:hypothetical protein
MLRFLVVSSTRVASPFFWSLEGMLSVPHARSTLPSSIPAWWGWRADSRRVRLQRQEQLGMPTNSCSRTRITPRQRFGRRPTKPLFNGGSTEHQQHFQLYDMKLQSLDRQHKRLKWLISQTSAASDAQLELQAHWGRYLCVLVAGFLESAIGEIYSEFSRKAASKPVAKYASAAVLRIQNPKAQRFVDTADAFKSEWALELEQFLASEGRKEAIDAVMANRHLVAHGRDSGITVARVQVYLEKCIEVVEFLEVQCGL